MEALSPDIAAVFALTAGVGFLMLLAGVSKNALEWRPRRRCPSCGRHIEGRNTCGCT